MELTMSGLDWLGTPLALRERLAFSRETLPRLLEAMSREKGVEGCVVLATCNRTEVYLTGSVEEPWRLLCRCAGVEEELEPCFTTRRGGDAARHILEVACGLHSQILGEGQIITQVRTALELAQAAGTADATLSALFRTAVTAGKRARTEVIVTRCAPSLGEQCRQVLDRELGGLEGKRILVIGNGQMGVLAAECLVRAGARVQMTLRQYRHGGAAVPAGCEAVDYDERVAALEGADALVSATASPHYVLTWEQLCSVADPPRVAVDLAVPRDIEPACAQAMTCYDTDALGTGGPGNPEALERMEDIVRQELDRFDKWRQRQAAPERPLRFPLFLDLTGKTVVVVGGGKIAARRIASLRPFGCRLVVVAPELSCKDEGLTWHPRAYRPGDLAGAFLAIAATPDRQVNHAVWEEASRRGIPVSVADCEAECSFYFPAICTGDNLIAGVVSSGKDHHRTARAAKEIRRVMEELE